VVQRSWEGKTDLETDRVVHEQAAARQLTSILRASH